MIAVVFVLIGAFALAAQTLLLREYLVVHSGNELAVGLFYGSWFLWIAVAATALALVLRRRPQPKRPGGRRRRSAGRWLERHFGWLLALYPVALLLQILLIRAMRSLAGVPPTEPFSFGTLSLWTALTNAPVSLVTGLIFPVGCALIRSRSPGAADPTGAVSRIYIFESLGSFLGGAAVTALISALVSPVAVTLLAALALTAGGLAYGLTTRARGAAAAHGLLLLLAAGLLGSGLSVKISDSSIRSRFAATVADAELLATQDTPYQSAAVARLGEQVLLLSNGRIIAALPDERLQAMRAALLMSQPAQRERVLLIGTGAQCLVHRLLDYPQLQQLIYVEADEQAFRLAEPYLPRAEREGLADPRIRLVFTDARFYVQQLAREKPNLDLIILALPDPDTAALNRYFTAELYQAAAALLGPGGVLATRISSGENVLTSELLYYGASIDRTLRSVLRYVVATPGEESWFVASNEPGQPSADAAELASRYQAIPLGHRLFPAEGFKSLLEPERVAGLAAIYQQAQEAELVTINRDSWPVTYFYNLLILGRQTSSAATDLLAALRAIGMWFFLSPLFVFVVLRLHYVTASVGSGKQAARRLTRFNAALLLFAVGLSAIALQIVLIFAFQNRFGLIYEQIGLLSALLMVGLAAGAALGVRIAPARSRLGIYLIIAALIAAALALPRATIWSPTATPELARYVFYGLFVLIGGLCGATFPLAGRLAARATGRAGLLGSLLESADHWGAALGAVLTGTLLVPVAGVAQSCTAVAALLAAALLVAAVEGSVLTVLQRALRALRLVRAPLVTERARSFPWSGKSYVLLGVTVAVLVVSAEVRHATDQPQLRLDPERLRAVVPQAERFEEHDSPFRHYRAFVPEQDRFKNISLASLAVTDDIMGYNGPLNLLLSVDDDGTIRHVALLSSEETPAYITELPAWLKRFEGKSIRQPFVEKRVAADTDPDREVDLITGASVSSRAAMATINTATAAVARQLLQQEVRRVAEGTAAPPLEAATIYLLVALLLAIPIFLRGPPWVRWLFLAANLVLGGVVFNVQLSLSHLCYLAVLQLPTLASLTLFVLLVGVAVLALAFGPAYCGLLCPFGAAQELVFGALSFWPKSRFPEGPGTAPPATRLGRVKRVVAPLIAAALLALLLQQLGARLFVDLDSSWLGAALLAPAAVLAIWAWHKAVTATPAGVSPKIHARARYLKHILLALLVSAFAVTGSERVLTLDPLVVAFAEPLKPIWSSLLLLCLLLLCSHYFRFWCRYFCPVGALLTLFNKVGLLLPWARPKSYHRCDLGVVSRIDVDCIQCNRCLPRGFAEGEQCHSGQPLPSPGGKGA